MFEWLITPENAFLNISDIPTVCLSASMISVFLLIFFDSVGRSLVDRLPNGRDIVGLLTTLVT